MWIHISSYPCIHVSMSMHGSRSVAASAASAARFMELREGVHGLDQPPQPHLPGQTGLPVGLYKFVGYPEFEMPQSVETLRHKPNREGTSKGFSSIRHESCPYLISTLYSSHLLFSPALLTCSSHLLFRSSTYCNNHYFSSSSPDLSHDPLTTFTYNLSVLVDRFRLRLFKVTFDFFSLSTIINLTGTFASYQLHCNKRFLSRSCAS